MVLLVLETLVIASLGGILFSYLHTPLPWILGSLTTILLWNSLLKREISWPDSFANIGQIIIGYSIGRTFTQETCEQIIIQLPTMLLVTIVTILFSFLMGYIAHKKTGISVESSLIGSIPGGLSQTAVLCAEVPGSDITVVTVMQTARVLSVIFLVPFLAFHGLGQDSMVATNVLSNSVMTLNFLPISQVVILASSVSLSAILAWKLGIPTPFLLGAVLGTASISLYGLTLPPMPQYWLNGAQLCIGAYTGARINLSSLTNWRKILPYTMIGVIGLIFCSIVIAFLLMRFHDISLITAFLSTAPGGMAEMGLTGILLHADLSVIVAFQLFRLLFVLMILPPVLKWCLAKKKHEKMLNHEECG